MTDTPVPAAAESPEPPAPTPAPAPTGNPRGRRRAFAVLGAVLLVALIVWAVFHFLLAKPEEETDDAYVAGDVVAITARDPGTVLALHADNTQSVKAGQPLIELDPTTAEVNLAAAAAELARAVRATRADVARVGQSDAAIVEAQAQLSRAQDDYARRRGAAAQGAVSGEELDHAADAVKVAAASLRLAREQRRQTQSAVQGTDVDTNPAVLAAIAAYRRAAIVRGHMRITAPIDGVVAQRTVQVGQQIAAGTPLMAIVPLDRLWVDANFRETQLKDLRIGQPATLVADTYGDDVIYHGRVVGVGAGSGNAFALLPPQNASGNWIKIVQRVPVRIALDPKELRANPLRVGLSVKATVDTADRGGARLAQAATAPYRGDTTQGTTPEVEAEIRRIVAANR
ncbi:EmrA/EmrK family multidrug efflux transporter periplasmic adaptor subunit [Sphingomonas ginsenosidimutans]|jgi:membrane fusion protein (multidrug efflux system)|uniref:EmrA/EmrK family multidrug efflux transporter periplasmic adaptor subunit n=1 Tax=Sphingomonas ginsenosidimutans TaxID=862134 RepID=A0A2A4I2H2_9SPHN|nr:HlyD family efflux transporter periplasmic adaptor subunit [Sphingomonas ginsenosidimutans]PCG10117.1 EmrA/EmrK family multidrug efflux transporter periplasmic adaptor subunit [Sphingomonas ginsenosidimutans]